MPNDGTETSPEGGAPQESENFRQMRERLEAASAKAARVDDLAKENAILKLGLDPEAGTTKLFLNANIDFSDTDAVKAAAQEYGLLKAEADETSAEDQAAQERVSQAAAGAGTPVTPVGTGPDYGSMTTEAEVIAAVAAAGGTVYYD